MVVQAVILLCLQDHRTERLELRDLPRHKTLPCHIEFIRVSTLTAKNDLEFIRDKYFHDTSPEKLVVVVFLHHLPEEGEARRLDHLPHRQQHLRGLGGESDLPFLAANYLENFLVPHIFLSHVRKDSRNVIEGLGFVNSPNPGGPNSYD